jgi:hypothetical protein
MVMPVTLVNLLPSRKDNFIAQKSAQPEQNKIPEFTKN